MNSGTLSSPLGSTIQLRTIGIISCSKSCSIEAPAIWKRLQALNACHTALNRDANKELPNSKLQRLWTQTIHLKHLKIICIMPDNPQPSALHLPHSSTFLASEDPPCCWPLDGKAHTCFVSERKKERKSDPLRSHYVKPLKVTSETKCVWGFRRM